MNTPQYAIVVELAQPLADAIETLRSALAAEQMGIVSEVDVQATLKNKLGIDTHPQKLLGVCSPAVAHALITAEPDIASLLPCGCSVSEPIPGHSRIAFQDPRVIGGMSDKAEIRAASETAHAAVRRTADRLAAGSRAQA